MTDQPVDQAPDITPGRGSSRRAVLQRGAVAGAAVWSAPAITGVARALAADGSPPPPPADTCDPFPTLYAVGRDDTLLRQINPSTGGTISSVDTGLAWTALAAQPGSGQLYGASRTNPRNLHLIDSTTGATTLVGELAERIAGLAFLNPTTLYAVSGDGASTPESLFIVSLVDASLTFVRALGNGDDGEELAHRDGLLYHASGLGTPNVDEIFESIDPSNAHAISNIPYSGYDLSEVTALTYDCSQDVFLAGDLADDLVSISPAGVVARIGDMGAQMTGLAFST